MLHVSGKKVEAVVVGRFVIIRNKRLLVQETVYCILPQEERNDLCGVFFGGTGGRITSSTTATHQGSHFLS